MGQHSIVASSMVQCTQIKVMKQLAQLLVMTCNCVKILIICGRIQLILDHNIICLKVHVLYVL